MVRNVTAGALVIPAPQQISANTVPTLERQIDEAIAQRASAVEFDLAITQIIDSAGLNWLLNSQSRLGTMNIPLRLAGAPPIIIDVLHATRLESRFTLVPATGETTVDLQTPKSGETVQGLCGMGMYSFSVKFH